MSSWRCGFLVGALLLTAPMLGAREAAPPGPDAPPVMPPADKKIDPALLPGDSVIVLTPEELQKRLDKARQEGRNPLAPTECHLKNGEVKNGFVLFEAEFVFNADRADAVFALACGQAKVTDVKKPDGRTPMLSGDANGYYVQAGQTGACTVTLYLSVPLGQRPGGGRGLELNLPRAVVTSIDMALPPDSRAVRVNGKDVVGETSLEIKDHRLTGPLGIVDKLDLSWQGPPGTGVQSLRTVSARVTVRVEGGATTTEADLVLRAQGEPAAEWTVIAPHDFEIKPSAAALARIKSITHGGDQDGVAWTVVLKAPSTEDLTLTATPAAGKRPPIGPFLVREASRQSGVVLVSAAGPDAHVILHPHPDLTARDLTEEERKADGIRAYEYAAAPSQPWLTVEAGAAAASLKTRTVYAFNLDHTGHGLEWQVTAKFIVSSSGRTAVDRLDVQLPPGCEYIALSQPDVNITPDDANAQGQVLHVVLSGAPMAASTFSVKAKYVGDAVPQQGRRQRFALPRLVPSGMMGIQDDGAQIDVTVVPDLELLPPAEAEVKDPHHFLWQTTTTGQDAEISWQPYTPEVSVSSIIDLTIHGRRAEVQHELRLHFVRAAPTQLTLKTPAALGDSLKVVGQGAALAEDAGPAGTRVLKLLGSGLDQVVKLQYSFALTPLPQGEKGEATGPAVAVPLAAVDKAKVIGDEALRVWCDAGRLPLPPDDLSGWLPEHIEIVPDFNRLPVLVLHSTKPDVPLTLTFSLPAPTATVLVDRALIRADLKGDAWVIQASYLILQVTDDALEIELPDARSAAELQARLDGDAVTAEAVERTDADKQTRHIARLRLGARLFLKPAVLELSYNLPVRGVLQNTLTPPRLLGDAGQAPTRWRITLPPDYVALAPEGGAAVDWTVGLRGPLRLPAPRLAVANDELEQWFAGADAKSDPNSPSLVAWAAADQSMTVVFLPEWAWMLLCSLPLVLFGLLLFALVRRSYRGSRLAAFAFWLLVLPLAPAVGAAWAFHPTIVYAVAFGCEPGAVVLLLFLAFQVLLLERHRRRIVFLPNFRRARTGSSLVRAQVNGRPAGEPSTVDAPRPSGSSQQPA